MSVAIPKLRVGDSLRHETLTVYPLFADNRSEVDYRLSDTALADESVLVKEITEGGSVPDLLVENKGDLRVLFLEGEELIGAKQNRILNTSVLVAANTSLKVPVSCVEQGRWRYESRSFGSSGSHSPAKLRSVLKASVSRSVKRSRGHRSDQGEVWKEVEELHASHGVQSCTSALSDAFDSYQPQISAYREKLKYVEGATGVAIVVGDNIVSCDWFDKPATCKAVWDRLLSGVVFDALSSPSDGQSPSVPVVEQFVADAADLAWEKADTVGEGQEYRAESKKGSHASMLLFEESVVHGSVVAAV